MLYAHQESKTEQESEDGANKRQDSFHHGTYSLQAKIRTKPSNHTHRERYVLWGNMKAGLKTAVHQDTVETET